MERHSDPARELRPIRCLLANDPGPLRTINGIDYVMDAEDDFDIIILTNPRDRVGVERLMVHSSNPAAPMIAFSPAIGPRVDAVLTKPTIADFTAAVFSLRPLVRRLASLPPIPAGTDRSGLLALALSHTRNQPIEAGWQAVSSDAIDYPLLYGMTNARPVLEELANAGLMRRRFFERLHVCRHCGSAQMHAREVCVFCHTSNLSEQPLTHHYACGYQAGQSAFEHRDGYVCPKCHKLLRHYGVDYDKPGSIVSCGACGKTMAEPVVGFVCARCGGATPGDDAATRDWFHYDLLPDGLAALKAGRLPSTHVIQPGPGRHSLRDFQLIVGNSLLVAKGGGRPLTAWRVTFDAPDVAQARQEEIYEFVREIITQNMRQGDVVAALPAGLTVCLNDIDGDSADALFGRIRERVASAVKAGVELDVEVFRDDQVAVLLREINPC